MLRARPILEKQCNQRKHHLQSLRFRFLSWLRLNYKIPCWS